MTTGGLKSDLLAVFAGGVDAPLSDDRFNDLARAVFSYQCEGSDVYRAFCAARGATPEANETWDQIPAVPTRAFKVLNFNAHPNRQVEAVFLTSGTTRGPTERGTHEVADLDLYRGSIIPNFRAHLLPDGARLPMVSLALPRSSEPSSSLSYMLQVVAEHLTDRDESYVDPESGIDETGLESTLMQHVTDRTAVLIVGTAFTFVHWIDSMMKRGLQMRLPEGSRIMETGGFKGRSREVLRPDLYAGLTHHLGIPESHIVNEYGMTELLSQYYEPVLRGGPRQHVSPPWLRTRVLNPTTLAPVPFGQPGLVQHFDLANLNSVSAVLTEDMGILTNDGLELLGRASDAEPRGCSIAMDTLLSVAQ